MHVLAIHMKVMAPRQQLSDEWAALTGLWVTLDNQGKLMLKDNKVPLLLQDPLALMIHYILLLPVNIDLGELFLNLKYMYRTLGLGDPLGLKFYSKS